MRSSTLMSSIMDHHQGDLLQKLLFFSPLIALRPPKPTKLPLLKFGTQDPNVHNFGMQDPKISFNFFLCVLEPNIHTQCLFWNARSEIGFYFFFQFIFVFWNIET
jgi:hypothetical protein